MERDWDRFRAGGSSAGTAERSAGSPSDWYRSQVEQLTAHTDYLVAQDGYHDLLQARMRPRGAAPGEAPAAPWSAFRELGSAMKDMGLDLGKMASEERRLRAQAEETADEATKALYEEKADRMRELMESIRQEIKDFKASATTQPATSEGDRPKGLLDRLNDLMENTMLQRLATSMMGGAPEGGNGKRVETLDPEEQVIKNLNAGNRLREALGMPALTAGSHTPVPTDGSVRTDVLKLLLEDERERVRMTMENDRETRKVGALETTAQAVKENLGDAIGAARDLAGRHNQAAQEGGPGTAPPTQTSAQAPRYYELECDACHKKFGVPDQPKGGDQLTCPHCQTTVEVAG